MMRARRSLHTDFTLRKKAKKEMHSTGGSEREIYTVGDIRGKIRVGQHAHSRLWRCADEKRRGSPGSVPHRCWLTTAVACSYTKEIECSTSCVNDV